MPKPKLSASFTITINTFRPMGGVFPISASIVPALENPECVKIAGKNITVCSKAAVELIFNLPNPPPDPGYVLLGVAFAANAGDITVGMHTFPKIVLKRLPTSSSMTVTDQPQEEGLQHYGYVILVQCIASGEIGMIDPEIKNQPS